MIWKVHFQSMLILTCKILSDNLLRNISVTLFAWHEIRTSFIYLQLNIDWCSSNKIKEKESVTIFLFCQGSSVQNLSWFYSINSGLNKQSSYSISTSLCSSPQAFNVKQPRSACMCLEWKKLSVFEGNFGYCSLSGANYCNRYE